jgi:uncharacterized delta-60 repeat protein
MRIWLVVVFLFHLTAVSATTPLPDDRFGSNGIAQVAFEVGGQPVDAYMRSLAVKTDGSVVLGGFVVTGYNPDGSAAEDFAVAQLSASGQPDAKFGQAGRQRLGVVPAGNLGSLSDVQIGADGRLIYMGTYGASPSTLVVGRLTATGQKDFTFNSTGRQSFNPGDFLVDATEVFSGPVKIQADGRILGLVDAVGQSICAGMVQLEANGGVVSGFGHAGTVCYAPPRVGDAPLAIAADFALTDGGKILLAGTAYHSGGIGADMFVARLRLDNGALDTTFGDGGWVFESFDQGGTFDDVGMAIGIDGKGRIILAGEFTTDDGVAIGLTRLTAAGDIDPGFGTGGHAQLDGSDLSAATVLADDRVLLVGSDSISNFVAVVTQAGAPDSGFGAAGYYRGVPFGASAHVQASCDCLYLGSRLDSPDGFKDFAALRYILPLFANGFEK